MTDLELAQVCAATYQPGIQWEKMWFQDEIWCAAKRSASGALICAFRGSETVEDWFDDLKVMPVDEKPLGFVHKGFFDGMRDVLAEWRAFAQSEPAWMTGHSLGAARACLMAGLLTAMPGEVPPLGLVGFGCPRPGFAKLGRIVRKGGYPVRIYENEGDPVPDVPWLMGLYRHVTQVTQVKVPATAGDSSIFAAHHIQHYVTAMS